MAVPEELLERGQIHAGFEQVGGEAVSQGMDAALRADASGVPRGAINALHRLGVDRRRAGGVGKQPAPRSGDAPPGAQALEQAWRQQRVAILAAFALAYLEAHAIRGALDICDLQGADLGDAQTGSVGDGE